MASIETRTNAAGLTVHRVRFRHDGRNRAITFTDKAKAEQWQVWVESIGPAAALDALDTATGEAPRTVAEHVRRHIDHLTGVTEGTRKSYRSTLNHDIAPFFGDLPLSALDREAVAKWVQHLSARGLSGKSIRNRHGLLSAALSAAVGDKLIGDNPCRNVRLPVNEGAEMVFLSQAEFASLLPLIAPAYRPLVLTLVSTGMRFGEATALTIGDVDLGARTARIHQAWKMTGVAQRTLGPPKSKRSKRTAAMPAQLVPVLAPLMEGRRADEFLFVNARGGPVKQQTFWGKQWKPAVDQFEATAGKRPRIHDLRHTYVSWAIAAGISMPVIQRQLGHESIVTTIDRYGHLARSDFDALAAAVGATLPPMGELEG